MIIEGKTGSWEIVVGLEVHAQVVSQSKLFSGASATYGGEPNAQVSLVDAAFPGMLPVINGYVVEQAIKTGLGIEATVNEVSVFDRKNYFYADLPQGYQISQYTRPIVSGGRLVIDLPGDRTKTIGVTRLHLEQDAGKSMHDQSPTKSYIDLNRSGVALMEIVSEPDIRSPEEAGAYLKKLRAILRYLGTCDGNMEEGSMRCDANVSVRKLGATEFGTRNEIKNVNSIRHVMQAIEYEANRQVEALEAGETIRQETRLWDTARGMTRSMRSKEHAHDYRYFPDPDLMPLILDPKKIANLKASMPELPDAKKARFVEAYKLSPYDAGVLVAEQEQADFFETVAKGRKDPKLAANWVIVELFGALNKKGVDVTNSPVTAKNLAGLLDLIENETISGRIAKDVFQFMVESGRDAASIVAEKGLVQVTDTGAIDAAIAKVMAENTAKVDEYRAGKTTLFGWFVGQVMKGTGGKANPAKVNEILKAKLSG